MLKEKLYRRFPDGWPSLPTLGQFSTIAEILAFIALSGTVLSVAAKGIAIAFGLAGVLVVGVYLTTAVGLFITFISLLLLSILLDGYQGYVRYLRYLSEAQDAAADDSAR